MKSRPGCLVLFALPFALVGAAMGVWAASDLVQWRRMQTWKPVECRILYAELEAHRGDDSTTWRVKARYRYEVDGRVYVGDRVSTSVGSDNIGDFHRALYRRLEAHRRAGTPAQCWVNPADPRDAVLYRKMRWEMVLFKLAFLLAFGGAGVGLMVSGLTARRRARERPLEGQDAGAAATIPAATPPAGMLLVMGLGFLGLSAGVILPLLDEVKAGNYLALLFFLFPLVGLGLLGAGMHAFLRRRRFGRSRLRLLSEPAGPGGTLRGEVRIPRNLTAEFRVKLAALVISGKNNSSARELWSREQMTRSMAYGTFSSVSFAFELPGRLEIPALGSAPRAVRSLVARLYGGRVPVSWNLDLRADLEGVDYHETFQLPRRAVTLAPEMPAENSAAGSGGFRGGEG